MLFWVKLFYPAGVSLSCVMVVMRAGAFIVFCPSEELPPIFYPFFHKHIVQGLTGWNPLYKQSTFCVTFPFLWGYQVLVWHHCHHVLASSWTRQSRPLPFFPRGCTFSMVRTIACCPCHSVRVTSTLAVGEVARIAKRWLPELSGCLATHCGFLPKASALLIFLSCCLAHALSARCFPSFRPDTASNCSCLLLPPGFLDTREAGICAGSRAWSSSFFLV